MVGSLKAIYLFFVLICFGFSATPSAADPAENSRYIREVKSRDWVVVFVHGIVGDSRDTWTSGKTYWPELLATDKDFDGASIYVYEYPTSVTATLSINEVAENMRLIFDADGVSAHRNIVFLAHSMGGLILRNYLLKYRDVADRVRMSYFFATPTTGSGIAAIVDLLPKMGPQLRALRPMERASELANTQLDWQAAHFKFPSYCAFETLPTFGVVVVPQASATNLCNNVMDPINADHLSIVKPSGLRSVPYLAFKSAFMQVRPRALLSTDNVIMLTSLNQDVPDKIAFVAERPYQLALDLQLAFRDATYNQEIYFAGLADARIVNLPEPDDRGYARRTVDPKLVAADANVFLPDMRPVAQSPQPPPELRYGATITLAKKPSADDTLTLQAGPRSWVMGLADLNWKAGGTEVKGWWASARARIAMDDPDWIVPHHARLLRVNSGKGTTESILEAAIENLSKSTLPASELTIRAYGKEGEKCASLPSDDNNRWGPAPEELVLNWPRFMESKKADRAAEGAWVKLGNSAVPIKARFTEKGCGNPRIFEANVPIELNIAPGHVGRIKLAVTEMTQLDKGNKYEFLRREPIPALLDWPYVSISIKPTERIFPRSIYLAR